MHRSSIIILHIQGTHDGDAEKDMYIHFSLGVYQTGLRTYLSLVVFQVNSSSYICLTCRGSIQPCAIGPIPDPITFLRGGYRPVVLPSPFQL